MTGPFKPGELTAGQAAKLNELWAAVGQLRRMTGRPPVTVDHRGGVPVVRANLAPPDLLVEVTTSSGTPPVHTVKRKTKSSTNTVVDTDPDEITTRVIDPAGVGFANGTLLELVPIPDWPEWFWGFPATATATAGTDLLLCEVTVSSSTTHTVKRKTRDGSNNIVDFAGPVTFTQCLSTTTGALPVGTLVWRVPIPDAVGYYWIFPVGYASPAFPGIVSIGTQDFGGIKGFNYNLADKATAATTPIFKVYTDHEDTLVTGLGVDQVGSVTAADRKSLVKVKGAIVVEGDGYALVDGFWAVVSFQAASFRHGCMVYDGAGSAALALLPLGGDATPAGFQNYLDFNWASPGGQYVGMVEYPDSGAIGGTGASVVITTNGVAGGWIMEGGYIAWTDFSADPITGKTGSFGLGAVATGGIVTTLGANIGAGTNGNIVVRSGGAWNALAPPGADGTYTLQLVRSGGGTSYTFSWV